MHTSQLEGINKRTKVIKRTAQGNRGVECFLLEIKAALPGNA